MSQLIRLSKFVTKYISLLVILGALLSFMKPSQLIPFGKHIPYLLGFIMLGMGLTMSTKDFKVVLSRPKDVAAGIILRYLIMPLVAWGIAKAFALSPALAAGLILVGCCPSGTASNIMTFIAKGDTALSVSVSSLNTILAPILTPFLFLMFAGTVVPIDPMLLLLDIVKIVLLPILLGMALRMIFPKQVTAYQPIIPAFSVIAIVITVGVVVALNAAKLSAVAFIALLAVALHNTLGLGLGYFSARLLNMSEPKARAISYEIGMENSGLAVALALAHLDPIAAIPGAIFSVWHNFSGSLLASYWVKKDLQ